MADFDLFFSGLNCFGRTHNDEKLLVVFAQKEDDRLASMMTTIGTDITKIGEQVDVVKSDIKRIEERIESIHTESTKNYEKLEKTLETIVKKLNSR